MDDPENPARDSLVRAREASRADDYPTALENYRYFFEHALSDRASLYGVRLSYCLDEWTRLGRKYPQALVALEERRQEALFRLEATREPEHFHDFECISKYLNVHGEALDQFRVYHGADPELAASIVRFIWSSLVEARAWDLCSAYLGEPDQRYARAVAKFDEAMTVCRANPEFGGAEFEKQIQGWFVRDVSEVIRVLSSTGRAQEAQEFHLRASRDAAERGCSEIADLVASRAAL
jgi:hypothetical protein